MDLPRRCRRCPRGRRRPRAGDRSPASPGGVGPVQRSIPDFSSDDDAGGGRGGRGPCAGTARASVRFPEITCPRRDRVPPGAWRSGFTTSLIVDRYGEHLVLQTLSQGIDRMRTSITGMLVDMLAPAGILARNDPKVRALEGLARTVDVVHGEVPEPSR